MTYKNKKHICIEPMLDNEYCIGMYDETDSLILDKKYYTCGLASAVICAKVLAGKRNLTEEDIYIADAAARIIPLNKVPLWMQK